MQVVEPAVVSRTVAGALVGTVVAQLPRQAVDFRIVRDDRASITERAQVLLNDEADRGRVTEFGDLETIATSTHGLGVVLDHQQVVTIRNLPDRLHVCALTVQVNWYQGFRAGRDRRLDPRGVNTVRLRIGVHKHGSGTGDPDSFRRGEKRVRRSNALVAGADAQSVEREPESIRSIAYADRILGSMELGQFLFKPLQHGTENILSAFEYFFEVGVDLCFNVVILPHVPIESHAHLGCQHIDPPCRWTPEPLPHTGIGNRRGPCLTWGGLGRSRKSPGGMLRNRGWRGHDRSHVEL